MANHFIKIAPTEDTHKLFKRAIARFGLPAQRLKLVEECGELAAEAARLVNGIGDPDLFWDEMADVVIMIAQITGSEDNGRSLLFNAIRRKLNALDEKLTALERE